MESAEKDLDMRDLEETFHQPCESQAAAAAVVVVAGGCV